MFNTLESSILCSIIGGLGLLITMMVLASGYRSNAQFQKQLSARERYIAAMTAAPYQGFDWQDPDFLEEYQMEEILEALHG